MPPKRSWKCEVGVIGTINRDTIHHPDGRTIDSWGGILYSLKYLCRAAQVYPAVNIGYDCYAAIVHLLEQFPGLDLSLVNRVTSKNNHCLLHYVNQSDKSEIIRGGVPPLHYAQVKPLLKTDLILVNFISGRDISLRTLERLRKDYRGIIYIDFHSLTLGRWKVAGGFGRFLRKPRRWQRYAACADILQVNQIEFELLLGKPFSIENACTFFVHNLSVSRCLIITLGQEGCLVVFRDKKVRAVRVPTRSVARPCDTTGCGDIFAAGFISEYLSSRNPIKAARNGNCWATRRCRIKSRLF